MIQKVLNSLSKGKIEKAAERFRFALLVLLIPAFIAFLGFLTAQYFSRQQEYRADLHSMALLQKAGYNPVAMIWECFVLSQTTPNTHSLADRIVTSISDHPLSEDRMVECLRNLPDIETKKITIYGSERTKTQD